MLVASHAVAQEQRTIVSVPHIRAQIEHRLADHDIDGVTVTVDNGVVTLRGVVASAWVKNEAIDQAKAAEGVTAVVSELTIRRGESDRAIGEAVAEKLRRYVFFTVFDDVSVEVSDGRATLAGYVTMPYKADAMTKLASRVDGVQEVVDKMETLPVSSFDDQIRYAVATRIYNDPLFWNYAIQVVPPIHIIVKQSRVTLTGVVASEVERMKAAAIARETFGVMSVENKLRRQD
jgi:osmotically-inducible protein OsmY